MLKDLGSYVTALPVAVFSCCYMYSWSYYRTVLGDDYMFLASVQDYVTLGAAAVPLALSGVVTALIGSYFILHFHHRKMGTPGHEAYQRGFRVGAIIMNCILGPLLLLIAYRDWLALNAAVIITVCSFIQWAISKKKREDRNWTAFGIAAYGSILLSCAASGYDTARFAMAPRLSAVNEFVAEKSKQSGHLITTVSGKYLIREVDNRYVLRSPEGAETVYLFTRAPEAQSRSSVNAFIDAMWTRLRFW